MLFAVGIFLAPACAFANGGTPLIWFTGFHLTLGNLLIGLGEGLLLAWLFKVPSGRTCLLMIFANFFSMMLGLYLIGEAVALVDRAMASRPPLERGPTILVCVAAASYLLTILAEWPFAYLALDRDAKDWRRSLKMSAVAQTASYAILIPLYLATSSIGVYTNATVRSDLSFVRPPLAWVYYLNPDDKGLWRIRTDGTSKTMVLNDVWRSDDERLSPDRHPGRPKWDLYMVRKEPGRPNHPDVTTSVILADFATTAGRWWDIRRWDYEQDAPPTARTEEGVDFAFGPAADMRPQSGPSLASQNRFLGS